MSENNRPIIRNLSWTAVLRELCAAMARIAVITGVERRQRWTKKRAIIAAYLAPGAVVSDVARWADVCLSQIYRHLLTQSDRGLVFGTCQQSHGRRFREPLS